MGKRTCIFYAVTFNDVTACFSHESFVYQKLWSGGFELAASYVGGPGFKFQYGAVVFLIPSRQTAEYDVKFCQHCAVYGTESIIK